jgi:hypothetical protein
MNSQKEGLGENRDEVTTSTGQPTEVVDTQNPVRTETHDLLLRQAETPDGPESVVDSSHDQPMVKDGLVAVEVLNHDANPVQKQKAARESFLQRLKKQIVETGRLYLKLAKNPKLLGKGIVEVGKDLGYELPKSLFSGKKYEDKTEELNVRASQALAISEVVSTTCSFGAVAVLESMGVESGVAATAALIAANYIPAVVSYVGSYEGLTRGRDDYSKKEALIDGLKVIRDCVPAAIVLYSTEAPIMGALTSIGLSNSLSAAVTLILGLAFFTGVAKVASRETLDQKRSETN